jgi:hypothetical protein
VSPLPAPSGAIAPAALAAGVVPSPDSRGSIRIPDSPIPAVTPGPNPTADAGGWRGQGTPASVTLRTPEPTGDPGARGGAPPAAVPPAAGSPNVTPVAVAAGRGEYEQLQEMLAKRGVNWQRLETWGTGGEWKFTCSIPNAQNPSVSRMYEGTAGGRNGLAAVQAVLEQIDRANR